MAKEEKTETKKEEKTFVVYDEPTEFKRLIVNAKSNEAYDIHAAIAKMMNDIEDIKIATGIVK